MIKKLIVKEAWLLDENGHTKTKLIPQNIDEVIPSMVEIENISGGLGNIETMKKSWDKEKFGI